MSGPDPSPPPTDGAGSHEQRDRDLFDRIARQYAAKDLLVAHSLARRCRLEQTLAGLPLPRDAAILEVGCGAGFAARYLRGRYRSYLGIDHSARLIELAGRLNAAEGASFRTVSVEDIDSRQRFDLVLLIGVLHHLERMEDAMRRMVRLLAPGGWLAANEPQPANPLVQAARAVRTRIDRAYSEDQRVISRGELKRLFLEAGLEQVQVLPQGVFSTPFAEVAMPLQGLVRPLSAAACALDRVLESRFPGALARISWNLAARGCKPGD